MSGRNQLGQRSKVDSMGVNEFMSVRSEFGDLLLGFFLMLGSCRNNVYCLSAEYKHKKGQDPPSHPFWTRAETAASPIPLLPPVTTATFPLISGISSILYRLESIPAGLTKVDDILVKLVVLERVDCLSAPVLYRQ